MKDFIELFRELFKVLYTREGFGKVVLLCLAVLLGVAVYQLYKKNTHAEELRLLELQRMIEKYEAQVNELRLQLMHRDSLHLREIIEMHENTRKIEKGIKELNR